MSVAAAPTRRVTTATLTALRQRGEPAVWITAYDYPTAVFADRAGVDVLLVGDSAAMTMLGHENTTSITMDEMLVFTRAVCRGAKRAFVVGDMPFLSYQVSNARAILNAGAFVAAGCGAVKMRRRRTRRPARSRHRRCRYRRHGPPRPHPAVARPARRLPCAGKDARRR